MTLNEKRHNKGYTIKTTDQISETILNKHNQKIHRVPFVSSPVEFDSKDVKIDPYLLGVLLGDGHFSSKNLSITSSDLEIIDNCIPKLPNGCKIIYKGNYDYRIQSGGDTNNLRLYLKELNLCDLKSYEKFIPNEYKFNSKEVRLQVLQGLLDTDGTIGKHRSGKCRIQFTSTSKKLAEDVMFLVRSLGGYAYSRLRKYFEKDNHEYKGKIIKHNHDAYVVDIMIELCPFKLTRKAIKHTNLPIPTKMIKDVIPCGESECTCIRVEAEDRLFVVNGFNVTHNTFDDAICIFDESQNANMMQLKLFLTRFGENSKVIVTGDPTQSDLGGSAVALVDVMARLESLQGVGIIKFKSDSIVRHPLVAKIVDKLG
jgi:phosphate starvation-inducible PhoH-like protein